MDDRKSGCCHPAVFLPYVSSLLKGVTQLLDDTNVVLTGWLPSFQAMCPAWLVLNEAYPLLDVGSANFSQSLCQRVGDCGCQ